jgi:hypothetical protein
MPNIMLYQRGGQQLINNQPSNTLMVAHPKQHQVKSVPSQLDSNR